MTTEKRVDVSEHAKTRVRTGRSPIDAVDAGEFGDGASVGGFRISKESFTSW
jgi:hypothetical protein